MLQIDIWKRFLIWAVVVVGVVCAAPNLFYGRVEGHNDAVAAIEVLGSTPDREADAAQWPDFLPSALVNLGLDLRGGAHLLAEVHLEDVYASRIDALWPEVRDALEHASNDLHSGVSARAEQTLAILDAIRTSKAKP